MKPALALSLIVVAVLSTVVIEETRIKKLANELAALRALPPRPAAALPDAPIPPAATPALDQGPPSTSAKPSPEAAPATPPSSSTAPSRQVPDDFPEPGEARIREMAASDRGQLYLELGLTSRQQAYLESLISSLQKNREKLSRQWLASAPEERLQFADTIHASERDELEKFHQFFGLEDDFDKFTDFLDTDFDRRLYHQMMPLMDADGVVLNLDKENRLIAVLHSARMAVGGLDWTSPSSLAQIGEGNLRQRFAEGWQKMGAALPGLLQTFLSKEEIEAVVSARDSLREGFLESIPGQKPGGR